MRTNTVIRLLLLVFTLIQTSEVVQAQATCLSPGKLIPGCVANADLQDALNASPVGACGSATSSTTFGIWYTFTAGATSQSITVAGVGAGSGASLTTSSTYIEAFSGSCGSLTPISSCQNVGSALNLTSLVVGNTYFIRIYVTTNPNTNPAKRSFTISLSGPPANDNCVNAISLISGSTCNITTGSLSNATISSPAVTSSCTGTPGGDVWYSFVATTAYPTISLSNIGASFTSSFIQLLSGSCGAFTSLACANASSLTPASALIPGNTYYIRVYSATAAPSGCNWGFDICIVSAPPPSNDDCNAAINLVSNTTCSSTTATLAGATPSLSIPLGCSAAGTYNDVWFSFTAASASQTVTINPSNTTGTNITNPAVQLFSGSCGTLTSLACGTTTLTATGLTIGNTYYVRVSNAGSVINSSGTFTICVTHPVPPTPATYEISRTYINVTKGSTGGTVNPGDTLEMRAILSINTKTLDSLSFIDTLYNTKGIRLVPGSLAWRTNEGKIYGNGANAFTDALDADPGTVYTNGLDTVIRINIGAGSNGTTRGSLTSTSYPRVFGSPCLIMATYRVVVYAGYNTKINFKTGALTYKDQATGILTNARFPVNNLVVYNSPGLCPNAVSATNALGAESNGTFGTPSGTPLARNRGTTPYIGTGYTYMPFTATGGPNDYFYGIANNTSQTFTTVNTWLKPDASTYRVFKFWDITGDHTGASNPAMGNPACDTTKPVSPTNPCGYMLVINSAYRADTAFTYTVNNLCPNTYYELSAWFKNICYKCGADSLGRSATTSGYIPSAPGDSSGVRPNIAFDVNGSDYYTTGEIRYTGVTPTGSDSTNQWVKRGFVYLTGPTETSFLLTLRNNAPGGGGNDWALDDIAVNTCLPNMRYSPSLNPSVCQNNAIAINDTIRSYFNTYQNYKWQRSTDAGTSWSDISGATGTSTPSWNGSAWEYITSYTVPVSATTLSNAGDKYRVVVSTTAGNLSNASCQVTDGVSQIALNVMDCGVVLNTDLLSFNGKLANNRSNLFWTTTREHEALRYHVEKSLDGTTFTRIGAVNGHNNTSVENNHYSFTDSSLLAGKTYYRITITNSAGKMKYSRIIQLNTSSQEDFKVGIMTNPFQKDLQFDVTLNDDSRIKVALLNASGAPVRQKDFTAYSGVNYFAFQDLQSLSQGIYILQVQNKDQTITRKLIKK
jgi:trimeric autotransporter adhesin